MPDRRPTIWEQAVGLLGGDLCQMCERNDCEQRKVRTGTGFQACPHCDRPFEVHARTGGW